MGRHGSTLKQTQAQALQQAGRGMQGSPPPPTPIHPPTCLPHVDEAAGRQPANRKKHARRSNKNPQKATDLQHVDEVAGGQHATHAPLLPIPQRRARDARKARGGGGRAGGQGHPL